MNKKMIDLYNELYKNDEFYLYITMLISSSNIRTIEDCNVSLSNLEMLKNNIEYLNIPNDEKEKTCQLVEMGITIINRDKEDIANGRNFC